MILKTLKAKQDFAYLQKHGTRLVRDNVVVLFRPYDREDLRIGYIVSKKCGNAVRRNRIKRRLRESAKKVFTDASISGDYILIGRYKAYDCAFSDLTDNLQDIIDKRQ